MEFDYYDLMPIDKTITERGYTYAPPLPHLVEKKLAEPHEKTDKFFVESINPNPKGDNKNRQDVGFGSLSSISIPSTSLVFGGIALMGITLLAFLEVNNRIESVKNDLAKLSQSVNSQPSSTPSSSTLQMDVSSLSNDLMTLANTATSLQSDLTALTTRTTTLEGMVTALGTTVMTLQTDLTTLQGTVNGLTTATNSLRTDLTALQGTTNGLTPRVTSLEGTVGTLSTTADTLTTNLGATCSKVNTLISALVRICKSH